MKCYEGTIKVYINIDCENEQELKAELTKMLYSFKGLASIENKQIEFNITDKDNKTKGYDIIDLGSVTQ